MREILINFVHSHGTIIIPIYKQSNCRINCTARPGNANVIVFVEFTYFICENLCNYRQIFEIANREKMSMNIAYVYIKGVHNGAK